MMSGLQLLTDPLMPKDLDWCMAHLEERSDEIYEDDALAMIEAVRRPIAMLLELEPKKVAVHRAESSVTPSSVIWQRCTLQLLGETPTCTPNGRFMLLCQLVFDALEVDSKGLDRGAAGSPGPEDKLIFIPRNLPHLKPNSGYRSPPVSPTSSPMGEPVTPDHQTQTPELGDLHPAADERIDAELRQLVRLLARIAVAEALGTADPGEAPDRMFRMTRRGRLLRLPSVCYHRRRRRPLSG